ncbi:hypothetical protein QYE76_065518 [Lolium multiflorum]|uniref:Ribonuclease H1 N-terminal domain-containing protein n=1 Tax=Lolium multiflorum TaxID=4521 RepID=A0AAD8SAG4_LOLMU|nr:hypothetical protein QYE76_065518 [Lolium multiflorum]
MRKPTKLKEIQQLTGRVATLSRFVARLGEKALPFYALIKQGDKFQWNEEADRAFEDLKRTIYTTNPGGAKEKEPLLLYIAATPQVITMTYVVYKGRVPGVNDDWEDCRRQVHRFSGNSYKGYPTRVEAEGRYARYLAGEMRDMRRNRMKTMAFVMMVIVTMLVMFYVIVV